MWKYILADSEGNDVKVNTDPGESRGLVVATRPHKTFTSKSIFATNPTYGREMNKNAAYTGAAVLVHNGTDNVAWTMSEPVGTKWVADDTAHYYAGAKAMTFDNGIVGAIMQVINNAGPGTDIDMSGYAAITMWIYVGNNWELSDSFSLYAHLNGAMVGNKVYLEHYFESSLHNTWQYIDIPLADMGIAALSIDALRIQNEVRGGPQSPQFWIDDWYIQQTGAPVDYTVKPDNGTWLYVENIQITFVDAYDPALLSSNMPNLSYNKILGMTPTTGYVLRIVANEVTLSEVRFINLLSILSYPNTTITNYISDGTNTLITIAKNYPEHNSFILKSEEAEKLVITIEDNFSQLLAFRMSVNGHAEKRQ